jgi:hypothetical protein
MIDIKVTYEDGNVTYTGFNGTLEQARAYFVGKSFNFGDTDFGVPDRMVKAVEVEEVTK